MSTTYESRHRRFWICVACGAQNSRLDGDCQYCVCEGADCKRDNCDGPDHGTSGQNGGAS